MVTVVEQQVDGSAVSMFGQLVFLSQIEKYLQ